MSSTTGFYHGIRTNEIPTSIMPARKIMSALPIAFGCAPIHRLSAEDRKKVEPGKIVMIYSLTEAGTRLGIDVQRDDFDKWTLSEVAYSEFVLFNVAPCVFVNLFDPAVHYKPVADEVIVFSSGTGQLQHGDIVGELTLTPTIGGDPYINGVDYTANAVTGEITLLPDGAMKTVGDAKAAYKYAAPELVTAEECIGGYDVTANTTTGISLVDDVFPQFREVPSIALAPKLGEDPTVAAVLAAKMESICGIFKGITIVDIPSAGPAGVKQYTDVPAYKQQKNLVSPNLYLCWPKVKFGDRTLRLSVQAAGRLAAVDADNDGIPYASPSNKNLQMTSCVVDGEELWLDVSRANYLNGNGIATALNWQDGWKLWGNRTACYPDNTDPKDAFITGRRMMCWYANRLTLQWWQKLDWPMTRRLVQTVINSEQYYLNSLVAGEYLHGGRIELLDTENSITDLIDGQISFHIYLGLVPPAERIIFNLEYDPNYIQTLFDAVA